MFSFKIFALFLFCCTVGVLPKKLPSYIEVCKRDQSTINACLRHSIESLRPKLVDGLPEIDVPGIDPFYIPEVVLVSSAELPIRASGKRIRVTGARNFTLKSVSFDLDTLTIKGRARFPRLHLEGLYSVDTHIIVPIKGKGTLKAEAIKVDAEMVLRMQTKEHNGVDNVYFPKMDLSIGIKDYNVHLDGLFNGDPVLGEATNQIINANRGEFLRAIKPVLESTISDLFLDIANKVVSGIPLDEVLPLP